MKTKFSYGFLSKWILAIYLIMIFSLSFAQPQNWSDPKTWNEGLPRQGENILIPKGEHIILDTSPVEIGNLVIQGTLEFARKDISLAAKTIMVMNGGLLKIGTESNPYKNKTTITVYGLKEEEQTLESSGANGSVGRFIMAMMGGRIQIIGASKDHLSWTQITETVLPSETSLKLNEIPKGWKIGDKIALASSSHYGDQAEELTITDIQDNIVSFQPPLKYKHFGELQEYGGMVLDERAEVGLLTRNILIQGVNDSQNLEKGYGAHIMIMHGGFANIEGVELFKMGQKGRKARYPMHWHYVGDRPEDFIKNSSIHHSNHRAIVVHGTNKLMVSNNVAFDVFSHTYVPAEDGTETDNKFYNNLGMLTRRLDKEDFAFPNDNGDSNQTEQRPGVFWLKNTLNELIGNHAAGSVNGIGFFFDSRFLNNQVLANVIDRLDEPLVFRNNVSHSNYAPARGNALYGASTTGYGIFSDDDNDINAERLFENNTTYKNSMAGTWIEGQNMIIENSISADNGSGHMLFQSKLLNSVIVGQSKNSIEGTPPVPPLQKFMGAIHFTRRHGGPKRAQIQNVQIFNQRHAAITSREDYLLSDTFSENIKMENVKQPFLYTRENTKMGFIDKDGSLTSEGPSIIVAIKSPLISNECKENLDWNASICPLENYNKIFFEKTGRNEGKFEKFQFQTRSKIFEASKAHRKLGPSDHLVYSYVPINEKLRATSEVPWPLNFYVKSELIASSENIIEIPNIATDVEVLKKEGGDKVENRTSLFSLRNAENTSYFYENQTNKLFLKFVYSSEDYQQSIYIDHSGNLPNSAGINSSTVSLEMIIYPIPVTNGILNIQFANRNAFDNNILNWEIFDILGRPISNGKIKEVDNRLNLKHLKTGFYIIRISDYNQQIVLNKQFLVNPPF